MRHAPGRAWFRPTLVWRPLSRLLLALLLVGAVASCTDGGAPTAPGAPGTLRLLLQQNALNTCTPSAPITHIRLTARAEPGGAVVLSMTFPVPATSAGVWDVPFEVPFTGEVTRIVVLVELITVTGTNQIVQCSGLTEPIDLRPGRGQQSVSPVIYDGPPENLLVTSVVITTPIPPSLSEGETLQLVAEVLPATARVSWRSLDPGIATVDDNGLVTLLRDGVARIVAEAGPRSDVAVIQSLQRPVSVVIGPASLTAASFGDEPAFTATVLDARGAPMPAAAVNWSIDDASIAANLGFGVFRAAANGTTTVRASVAGTPTVASTATLVVRQQAASLTIDPGTFVFSAIGASNGFVATARDARDNVIADAPLTWSSSATDVATAAATGLVTATGNGAATITVRSGTAEASASVHVQQVMARIVVSPDDLLIESLGATGQLQARVFDARDHEIAGLPVQWSSSDPAVTVDASGMVRGLAPGSAVITASAGGMSATATVTVRQRGVRVGIAPASLTAHSLGDILTFSGALLDEGGSAIDDAALVWSVANPDIAENLGDGAFRALADGTTHVTVATADGALSATGTLIVSQRATRVEVTPASFVFTAIGLSTQLAATAFDAHGHVVANPGFQWTVEGGSVSVSDDGTVTAAAAGTSVVRATAIGGASGTAAVSVRQAIASMSVEPTSLHFTQLGTTAPVTLTARDSEGHVIVAPEGVVWTSSSAAASVSGTGVVTARARGAAVITATAGTLTARVDVAVEQTPASIEIEPEALDFVSLGQAIDLVITVRDAGGSPIPGAAAQVVSSSSDIVGISGHVATSMNVGTATITATFAGLSAAADAVVRQVPNQLNAEPASIEVEAGGTAQIVPEVLDAEGNPIPDAVISYSSADPGVATVDADGVVTGVVEGSTEVTVRAGELSRTIPVAVTGGGTDGVITGRVVHALTQASIEGAEVAFVRQDQESGLLARIGRRGAATAASPPGTYTGPDGRYTSPPLAAGSYTVLIRADGFIETEIHDVVVDGEVIEVETVPLVPFSTQTGSIAGRILNAQTGGAVGGATVELRSGVNALVGPPLATTTASTSGSYTFTGLPAGTYSVLAYTPGFIQGSRTGISVGGTLVANQDISLIDEAVTEGEVRIVLTWGANPSDLDSHLTGPISGSSSRFHVYWANPGSLTSSPFASLDVDDVTSFGPETITIAQQFAGLYRYTVHHWGGSGNLATSSAVVRVFRGNTMVARFEAPPMSSFAEWWHVFDLSGDTLTPVNTYGDGGAANGMSSAQFEQFLSVGKK